MNNRKKKYNVIYLKIIINSNSRISTAKRLESAELF